MRSPALAAVVSAVVVAAAVAWSAIPTSPLAADAPATDFSEERASSVLATLVDEIGHRTAGSDGATRALAYLETTMRAIPGLEVVVQDITALADGRYSGASVYRVRNVVARLPGESPETVLIAAHYDSATMSVGAADDALSVAAVVDVARALAAGPKLRRTVVFLLDEGEELGLFGAQGFLKHRFAGDVVTFVNLEAAGARGRPILFQTGPGDPWLAGAYASAAPHPRGTVMGQDVFQSGIIPSDTDFRVYRDERGLRGLDVALYRDGWAYHTHLDRTDRLESGSLQEMGANALAVTRELATMDIPTGHSDSPAVYYDILGLWMISYAHVVAWLLAGLAIVALGRALRIVHRQGLLSPRDLITGTFWSAGALVSGVVVAIFLATLIGGWMARPHGWFARPWLAVAAYGVPAVLVTLLILRLAVLRSTASTVSAATRLIAGTGVVFALLLMIATGLGVGSGYMLLWWVVGCAGALRIAALGVTRLGTALVAGWMFPALLTLTAGDALLATFVPMAGRMGVPMDGLIAVLAALPLVAAALLPGAIIVAYPPDWGRFVFRTLGVVAVASLVAVAIVDPYTPERPRRIALRIDQSAGSASVGSRSMDGISMDGDRLHVARPLHGMGALPRLPGAELVLVEERQMMASKGTGRVVRVRLDPHGATAVRLRWEPADSRIIVDDGTEDGLRLDDLSGSVTFVAPNPSGVELTFVLDRDGPLQLDVRALHSSPPEALRDDLDTLPDWVALDFSAWVISTVEF